MIDDVQRNIDIILYVQCVRRRFFFSLSIN